MGNQPSQAAQNDVKAYEAPTIVYEARISTRAGTPTKAPVPGPGSADPIDLFGKG